MTLAVNASTHFRKTGKSERTTDCSGRLGLAFPFRVIIINECRRRQHRANPMRTEQPRNHENRTESLCNGSTCRREPQSALDMAPLGHALAEKLETALCEVDHLSFVFILELIVRLDFAGWRSA